MRLRKDAKIELLASVPLFAGLSKKDLGQLASIADEVDVRDGRTLIREGELGQEFLVLVEGTVTVTKDGRKVADLGPGTWVGEIALVSNVPRVATVTTTSPVRLLVITPGAFSALLRRSPTISQKIMETMGRRLAELQALSLG